MSGVKIRVPRKLVAEMNVVPYIDVMLVLLVIFMATAPMMTQGINVDLPDSNSAVSYTHLTLPTNREV